MQTVKVTSVTSRITRKRKRADHAETPGGIGLVYRARCGSVQVWAVGAGGRMCLDFYAPLPPQNFS